MENISRDLRRRLKQPGSGAREKRRGRWTLLFVEDRGKVISLENVKGMMIAGILFLAAVTAAAAGFFFLYNRSEDRNSKLQKALMDSEQRAIPLRNKKDALIVRLGVAEAQIEMLRSRNGSSKREDAGGVLTGGPPDENARKSSVQPEKRERVAIEKVKIFYDPGAGIMETEFRLTNILGTGEPVSGFIFVVFRKAEASDDGTMVLPAVRLISGKPADVHRGRRFLISRFNVIRFKTAVRSNPADFQHVTVFVYAESEELMLSVDFPFRIEEVPIDIEEVSSP